MAIQQTGLGWYADSTWLANQAVEIGKIVRGGGPPAGFTNQPVPYFDTTPSAAQVKAAGLYGGYYQGGPSNFMGTNVENMYVAWENDGTIGARYTTMAVIVQPYTTGTLTVTCWGTSGLGDGSLGTDTATFTWSSDYQFYIGTFRYTVPVFPSSSALVPIMTRLDFYQAISQGGQTVVATFDKSSAGYSITCMCKWITEYGGDVYCSPILISSVANNTLYTRNSSTPSINATEHTFEGMTFYMRKAPLDILDETETINSSYPYVDLSGVAQTNDTIFSAIAAQSGLGVGYPPQSEDPYSDGGTSGPEAGTPHFDEESEFISPDVEFPSSFSSTGFCRVYAPTAAELSALADYMWTDQTFIDTFINNIKNHFENMMESIISLTLVPCVPSKGTAIPVKVMYISTNVSMAPVTSQFKIVNCGTVRIDERYGSALDYNPYTKVSVYLPFIGTVPLDTDEVMNRTIRCEYTIDVLTGNCVAKITILTNTGDTSETADRGCFYEFSGNCAISMPFNSGDFTNYFSAAMTGLKTVAGLIATGAGAPTIGAALLDEPMAHPSSTKVTTTARNPSTGRQITTGTETTERTPASASFKELAVRGAMNTVSSVANSKFIVEHGSGFSGNSGFMSVNRPFVIITRPNMCNPDNYGSYNGRPCMMYLNLGTLHGYTQVQNIHLTGFSATNPELGEISELLKSGVIL